MMQKKLFKPSKNQQEAISKFKYHTSVVVPSYLVKKTHLDFLQLQNFTNQNGVTFFYGDMNISQKQPIHAQLEYIQFIQGFERLISHHENNRLQQGTYLKSTKFNNWNILQFNEEASEIIEIVLIQHSNKSHSTNRKSSSVYTKTSSTDSSFNFSLEGSSIRSQKCQQKSIFIIHRCSQHRQQDQTIQWSNFVQQYCFKKNHIEYKMVCTAKVQQNFLKLGSKKLSTIQKFIKHYCCEQSINKYIGILNQSYMQKKNNLQKIAIQQEKNDPAIADEHNRLLQLPPQKYHVFQALRSSFDNAFSDNQICRFIHRNGTENIQKIKQQIEDYLTWRNALQRKYTMNDFKDIIQMDIIRCLGQDKKGRPLLFGFPFRIDIQNIDIFKLRDFMLYLMQIELPKRCRGYVDSYTFVGDIKHFSTKNFSLYAVKVFAPEYIKYTHERLGKAIAINVSSFAYYVYTFLKNTLLQQSTTRKLTIVEQNKEQIYQTLLANMSIDVIPSYLGGKNHIQNWPNYPQ